MVTRSLPFWYNTILQVPTNSYKKNQYFTFIVNKFEQNVQTCPRLIDYCQHSTECTVDDK